MEAKGIALYTTRSDQFNILIPRKRGTGYLLYPFGGHHAGAKYFPFMEACRTYEDGGIIGDIFDTDGYARIHVFKNTWEPGFDRSVETIKAAIQENFPQVEGFKELDWNDFFDMVIINANIKR